MLLDLITHRRPVVGVDLTANISGYEGLCRDAVVTGLMGGTPSEVPDRLSRASATSRSRVLAPRRGRESSPSSDRCSTDGFRQFRVKPGGRDDGTFSAGDCGHVPVDG